jgi:Zn finger protein HypA/HybF involved in hydrogenase expression
MAKRTYSAGRRTFEITLSGRSGTKDSSWIVESVIETTGDGRRIEIRTMPAVQTSTEDEALARACDHIDTWLSSTPGLVRDEELAKSSTQKLPPSCPQCRGHRTRIVGQSGRPPVVHYRCEQCGHVFSRERGDE